MRFSNFLQESARFWQIQHPVDDCVTPSEPYNSALENVVCYLSPEATVTLVPVWKRGVAKQGTLKSLVSHFLNFKSWIKLIYDTLDVCNFVINEFNPTFEIQNMGSEAFPNALF